VLTSNASSSRSRSVGASNSAYRTPLYILRLCSPLCAPSPIFAVHATRLFARVWRRHLACRRHVRRRPRPLSSTCTVSRRPTLCPRPSDATPLPLLCYSAARRTQRHRRRSPRCCRTRLSTLTSAWAVNPPSSFSPARLHPIPSLASSQYPPAKHWMKIFQSYSKLPISPCNLLALISCASLCSNPLHARRARLSRRVASGCRSASLALPADYCLCIFAPHRSA
jgi:hypothetical protein